jgi:hypothetical protein
LESLVSLSSLELISRNFFGVNLLTLFASYTFSKQRSKYCFFL